MASLIVLAQAPRDGHEHRRTAAGTQVGKRPAHNLWDALRAIDYAHPLADALERLHHVVPPPTARAERHPVGDTQHG